MAFDFLKDTSGAPKLCEISFGFAAALWPRAQANGMKASIGTRVAFGHRMPFSKTCLSTFCEIRSTQIETELSGTM